MRTRSSGCSTSVVRAPSSRHAATFEPFDRWTGILVRLGRASLSSRVEAHLRALKERAEAAQRSTNPAT